MVVKIRNRGEATSGCPGSYLGVISLSIRFATMEMRNVGDR